MIIKLCNLKNLPKKKGGGEFYIADLLVIDGNSTALINDFITQDIYNTLNTKRKIKELTIDEKYIKHVIRNNQIVCSIDYSNYLKSI